jgi:hypothetical protein
MTTGIKVPILQYRDIGQKQTGEQQHGHKDLEH